MSIGKKGIGMHKHGKSGRSGKSPKFRAHMKREAEAKEIKDTSRIKDPKTTVSELFKN